LYSNDDDEYVAQLAAKRYQKYLKEEEKNKKHSKWVQDIIAAILMLIKLITNALQKADLRVLRTIEIS
jgi:septin family protein